MNVFESCFVVGLSYRESSQPTTVTAWLGLRLDLLLYKTKTKKERRRTTFDQQGRAQ
jgi:hypothetical protein